MIYLPESSMWNGDLINFDIILQNGRRGGRGLPRPRRGPAPADFVYPAPGGAPPRLFFFDPGPGGAPPRQFFSDPAPGGATAPPGQTPPGAGVAGAQPRAPADAGKF